MEFERNPVQTKALGLNLKLESGGTVVSLASLIKNPCNSLRFVAQTIKFEQNLAQTKALGLNPKHEGGGAREMHLIS
jgi:hypothetical protein